MPHEATVDHTDTLNDDVQVGAHMRAKETWSKQTLNSENQREVSHIRPPTPEKNAHNFDDDEESSDEGASDQPVDTKHHKELQGAF